MSSGGRIEYAELVDLPKLQALMESFSQVIGIANAVIDIDGKVIVHAGWQDACTAFHRVNTDSCQRCIESDTSLVESMTHGTPFAIYRCHNGLLDSAARIVVDGQHVANVFTGQFLTEEPDLDFFRAQARQFGFDEARYLEAIARLPILPYERVESVTRLYAQLAGLLADNGLSRVREMESATRLAAMNQELQAEVATRTQALERVVGDLAGREALLKQILDTSSVAIFVVDRVGRITQANQRMAEMFGRSLETLVGGEYVALLHPEARESGRQNMQALLSSTVASVDVERLYARGEHGEQGEFWGHLTGKRFYDANGEESGLVGVIADINERKRAEHDLRIAAIAFDSQEGIFITDAENVILRVNRAFTEITGYSAAEAVGQTPHLLASGKHDDAFLAEMTENIRDSGTWHGEILSRRKSGEIHPEWLTITVVKDAVGDITNYVATLTDISARKESEDRINNLAFYDTLTGLPNRTLLQDRLKQTMTASTRSGTYGALLFIDLDNFKTLNDTLGHDSGDLLLKQVAQRLSACVRAGDTVARLGGDEFVVILAGLSTLERDAANHSEALAEKILVSLGKVYQLGGLTHQSTASIGVTLFRGQLATIDDLMKQADLAMYRAKDAGRNAFRFFDPAMEIAVKARAALEADLRLALEQKQFLLQYQAQVVDDDRLTGAEVLVRWQHPRRGMVSPAEFIPLAEETGLILPLGLWVLETACRQLTAWADQPALAHLTVAVNVSAHQFRQNDFVDQVLTVLQNTGANPQRLKLELTESLLVSDVEEVIEKMIALKVKGVGFSLDDFGTGYSSLSYLKRLPLDQLKIDQSFVRDVLIDPNDGAIARTIIALGQSLGLGVIAEGVETTAQRDFLASSGCHAYQGYFFSRPLPVEDFEAFARKAVVARARVQMIA